MRARLMCSPLSAEPIIEPVAMITSNSAVTLGSRTVQSVTANPVVLADEAVVKSESCQESPSARHQTSSVPTDRTAP